MSNSEKILKTLSSLIENGILTSKDIKKEISTNLKFKRDGIINKLDYTFDLGVVKFQPRWKSEFQRYRPAEKEDTQIRLATTELRELFSLIARIPILSRTELQTGVEYLLVEQYRKKMENNSLRSDRNELVYALQFTNNVDFRGYNLWTQTGFRIARIDRASADKARTETAMFMTVYAGLE